MNLSEDSKSLMKFADEMQHTFLSWDLALPNPGWICEKVENGELAVDKEGEALEDEITAAMILWEEEQGPQVDTKKETPRKSRVERIYSDSDLGLACSNLVLEDIGNYVEKVRREIWGVPEAPFAPLGDQLTSFKKACDWIGSTLSEENQDSPDWPPKIKKRHLFVDIEDEDGELDEPRMFDLDSDQRLTDLDIRGPEDLEEGSEKRRELDRRFKRYGRSVRFEFVEYPISGFVMLTISNPQGGFQRWRVHRDMKRLGKLVRACEGISRRLEDWNEQQVADFILRDLFPSWGLSATIKYKQVGNPSIVISIPGPVTAKELLEVYEDAVGKLEHEIPRRPVSRTHAALLHLMYFMPKPHTWQERLEVWLEWSERDNNKGLLPTFNAKLNPDGTIDNVKEASQNLSKEYYRARKRVAWGSKRAFANEEASQLPGYGEVK